MIKLLLFYNNQPKAWIIAELFIKWYDVFSSLIFKKHKKTVGKEGCKVGLIIIHQLILPKNCWKEGMDIYCNLLTTKYHKLIAINGPVCYKNHEMLLWKATVKHNFGRG